MKTRQYTQPPDITLVGLPILTLLGILGFGACSGAEDTPIADESTSTAAQALQDDDDGDDCLRGRHTVGDLLAAQAAAFNAHDAAAFAATFTEDARLTDPTAATIVGRASIQAVHTFLFSPAGPFTFVSATRTITNVICLTNKIALVDLDASLTGYKGLPPGLNPTTPGVLRTIQRAVIVKEHHAWLVKASQATPVPPAPTPAP